MTAKDTFKALMTGIARNGIENLTTFLEEESDFYKAPCSTKHHLPVPGGLVQHSVNVHKLLAAKVKMYHLSIEPETVLITALFHDLCKVNYYALDDEPATEKQVDYLNGLHYKEYEKYSDIAQEQWLKRVEGKDLTKGQASKVIEWLKGGEFASMPELPPTFKVKDQFPIGHGEKSVIILQQYIHLTEEEQLAIRWHMGSFTDGFDSYSLKEAYNAATKKYKLIPALFAADFEASQIFEREAE